MTLEEDGPAAGQSPRCDKGKSPVKAQRDGRLNKTGIMTLRVECQCGWVKFHKLPPSVESYESMATEKE